MKILTQDLQFLVNKSAKAVGNSKLIPNTSWVKLIATNDLLTLVTNDSINTLYVSIDINNDEPFEAVVDANKFINLINKTTTSNIDLSYTGKSIKIKGNGTYEIPIELDNEGNLYNYPDPSLSFTEVDTDNCTNVGVINDILNNLKYSLAVTFEEPCYTQYYAKDFILSTNAYKISCMNKALLKNPNLIYNNTMSILKVFEDNINITYGDKNDVMFYAPNCKLISQFGAELDKFKIDIIKQLVDEDYDNDAIIDISKLKESIDRVFIFLDVYKTLTLKFTDKDVTLSDEQQFNETIPLTVNKCKEDFECKIDAETLKTIISTLKDNCNIQWGNPSSIKFKNGEFTHIVSLEM